MGPGLRRDDDGVDAGNTDNTPTLVILGLVPEPAPDPIAPAIGTDPGIHRAANVGASGEMDPRDKPEDDSSAEVRAEIITQHSPQEKSRSASGFPP